MQVDTLTVTKRESWGSWYFIPSAMVESGRIQVISRRTGSSEEDDTSSQSIKIHDNRFAVLTMHNCDWFRILSYDGILDTGWNNFVGPFTIDKEVLSIKKKDGNTMIYSLETGNLLVDKKLWKKEPYSVFGDMLFAFTDNGPDLIMTHGSLSGLQKQMVQTFHVSKRKPYEDIDEQYRIAHNSRGKHQHKASIIFSREKLEKHVDYLRIHIPIRRFENFLVFYQEDNMGYGLDRLGFFLFLQETDSLPLYWHPSGMKPLQFHKKGTWLVIYGKDMGITARSLKRKADAFTFQPAKRNAVDEIKNSQLGVHKIIFTNKSSMWREVEVGKVSGNISTWTFPDDS